MQERIIDLLYQGLETELGGVAIYSTAVTCAVNEDLKKEWAGYLDQSRNHVRIMRDILETLGLDPAQETPGRGIVQLVGGALVKAMMAAKEGRGPRAAEQVAAECVVLAEPKDHLHWEIVGELGRRMTGPGGIRARHGMAVKPGLSAN